jgi:hypothetical protein
MDLSTPSAEAVRDGTTVGAHVAWFDAPSAFGPLKLAVLSRGAAVRHAADAALALETCEPLLAALDDWTGSGLEWVWSGAQGGGRAGAAGADDPAVRTWLVWRGGHAMLACPLGWLRDRPAPHGAWRDELTLPSIGATLVCGRLRLPEDALSDLEPGGAVLVEPSFRPVWHGVLQPGGEPSDDDGGTVVTLAGVADASPSRPRYANEMDAAAVLEAVGDPNGTLCELRLALPQPVAVDGLLGWRDGPVGLAGPAASLWRCGAPRRAAQRLACGHLMPWGDGWALSIESLDDTHPG